MIKPKTRFFDEGPVSIDQLHKWMPLLRPEKVRIGDIMLTRGRTFESHLIARLSGGHWSHAAIWLPMISGYDLGSLLGQPLQLLEADEFGAGPTLLQNIFLTLDNTTRWNLYRLPGDPEDAVLLRHPSLEKISKSTLEEAMRALCATELYRAYPPLERIVSAASLPPALKPIIRRSLMFTYRTTQNDPISGSFCSELAAKFFSLLDMSIFREGIILPANEVSPNHLFSASSILTKVSDAFMSKDDIHRVTFAELGKAFIFFSRENLVAPLVEQKVRSDRMANQVEHITLSSINSTNDEIVKASKESAIWLNKIANTIEDDNMRRFHNHKALTMLYVSAAFARSLAQALESLPLNAELAKYQPRFHALLMLIDLYLTMSRQIIHDYTRSLYLASFRLARIVNSKSGRRKRAAFIREWRSRKQSYQLMSESFSRLRDSNSHVIAIRNTSECRNYFEDVLTEVSEISSRNIADHARRSYHL